MKRTPYGRYLTQLTKFPTWFPMNCYLVREDDGLTLIDTAMSSAPEIVAAAKDLSAPIVRVVLTHAHGDHVGSLDKLHTLVPDAEVLIGEREARLLAGDMSLDPGEPQTPPRGSFQKVTTQPTRLLRPDDHIGSLRVVAAPGHTPGHLAFLDERDGSLIIGDAMQTRGGVAVSGTLRWTFPFPAFATWHKPTALETVRQLRAIEPARIAVGHGPVLEAPRAAMDRAIADAERNLGGK